MLAAGAALAATAWLDPASAADPYGYRLNDRNRKVFGGPSGINIYPKQPYASPLDQPRRQHYTPDWKAAPGLNPLRKPRRDLRPWRAR